MPLGLRVVGIGGAPRIGVPSMRRKRTDKTRERATRMTDFIFDGEGTHGAAYTRRIRQRQYVLGRSPCQRHCRSRTRTDKKKGKRENAKKFAWGLMPI